MSDTAQTIAKTFSLHDSEKMQSPYDAYRAFREQCPVAHSDEHGGFFIASRYDAVKQVYQDYQTFSSADGVALPKQPMELIPIDLDPPQQTKYRKILNPWFTVEAIDRHRSRIETIVEELIDQFIADGAADLSAQLIRPALSATLLPILGAPIEDRLFLSEKLDFLTRRRASDPEGSDRVGAELAEYLMDLASKRRRQKPKDDILQELVTCEIDGRPLTDEQIFKVLMIILFGGLDTTSAAISEALLHFARNPQDAERLMSGEVPWAVAIEEFVRFASPIQGLRRTVTHDVILEGCPLHGGDYLIPLNASANHDPSHFAEPDRCIIERSDNEHLAFGAGAHICLGRNVARLVMEVVLKAVLRRIPDFSFDDSFTPEYAVGESRGVKTLPVRFTPSRPLV